MRDRPLGIKGRRVVGPQNDARWPAEENPIPGSVGGIVLFQDVAESAVLGKQGPPPDRNSVKQGREAGFVQFGGHFPDRFLEPAGRDEMKKGSRPDEEDRGQREQRRRGLDQRESAPIHRPSKVSV